MSKMCECGCGKEVVGEKHRFINGHNSRRRILSEKTKLKMHNAHIGLHISQELKIKLCECGCGRETINKKNRFLNGHCCRGKVAWSKGKKSSKETTLKISKNHSGGVKKHSVETKLKMSLVKTGKNLTEEHKLKLSLGQIKRVERQSFNGEPMYPCIGNNETSILNRIQTESGEEILRNDHTTSKKVGKFPDGYIKKYNLCIDVLEPHHFKSNGELSEKDQKRELRIAWKLGCMIYYIPEQEFLSNPDKEIQRFKEFLLFLKEIPN